jgi:hypothetical protein
LFATYIYEKSLNIKFFKNNCSVLLLQVKSCYIRNFKVQIESKPKFAIEVFLFFHSFRAQAQFIQLFHIRLRLSRNYRKAYFSHVSNLRIFLALIFEYIFIFHGLFMVQKITFFVKVNEKTNIFQNLFFLVLN